MKKVSVIWFFLLVMHVNPLLAEEKKLWGLDKSHWQEVSFQAKCDGTEQKYAILLPENFNPETRHNLLIMFHGMYGDRWQLYELRDHGPSRAIYEIAAENDLIVVTPDYRIDQWMGPRGEADTLQILVDLQRQYLINKVFIAGGSMGGSAVLTLAVRHPYLFDGVMSMNGTANYLEYENYQEYIQKGFEGTKEDIPLEYKNRSAEYWPENIIMPIGMSVGGQDGAVPPHSVTRLAKVLQQIKRRVLFFYRESEGHGTSYEDARAMLKFIMDLPPRKSQTKESSDQAGQ